MESFDDLHALRFGFANGFVSGPERKPGIAAIARVLGVGASSVARALASVDRPT